MAKKLLKKLKRKPSAGRTRASAKPTAETAERTSPSLIRQVISASGGILRLAPTWVPRSFLMPGRRLKLAPQDIYAYGAHRGGIDERWFASTTPAANENRTEDEGLSWVVVSGKKAFTLLDAIGLEGKSFLGSAMWDK